MNTHLPEHTTEKIGYVKVYSNSPATENVIHDMLEYKSAQQNN